MGSDALRRSREWLPRLNVSMPIPVPVFAGEPTDEPRLEGIHGPLERTGTASFGLASWQVWIEPGRAPTASGE